MLYNHALVAVDLTEDSNFVINKAFNLMKLGVKITVVHVIEPILSFGGDIPIDLPTIQKQQVEQATIYIETMIANHVDFVASTFVIFGQPQKEIHDLARDQKCDLIVLGSHGRKGFGLLLGSTTSDVLQDSPCDILSIDLKNITHK